MKRWKGIIAVLAGITAGILLLAHGLWKQPFGSRLVYIPGGACALGSREGRSDEQPRNVVLDGFWMGRKEVTVAEFAEYLRAQGEGAEVPGNDFVLRGKQWVPRTGHGRYPVTGVSRAEAERYCAWLGEKYGATIRLPTEDEWEYAARGSVYGGRYPWGWGNPEGKACFDKEGVERTGLYAPNPYGLYDMAGNVFEWCVPRGDAAPDVARGGSWAERSADCLRVFRRAYFEPGYADADVGFRIVVEGGRDLKLNKG